MQCINKPSSSSTSLSDVASAGADFSDATSAGADLAGKGDKEEGLTASVVSGTKGLSFGFGSAADCSVCSQTFPPLLWEVEDVLYGFLLEIKGCDLADGSFGFLAADTLPKIHYYQSVNIAKNHTFFSFLEEKIF